MKISDLNNKVNLSLVCAEHPAYKGKNYEIVRVPPFGYFVRCGQDIKAIYDLFPGTGADSAFRKFSQERKYRFFDIQYSEMAEQEYVDDLKSYQRWLAFYKACLEELRKDPKLYRDNSLKSVSQILEEQGRHGVSHCSCGFLTIEVMEQFKDLRDWRSAERYNQLIVPTFITPQHICSLETVPLRDFSERRMVWKHNESGWYGRIDSHHVVESFEICCTTQPAFTWDRKATYWLHNELELDSYLSLPTLVQIHKAEQPLKFKQPLLKKIAAHKDFKAQVQSYLHEFSLEDIQTLEKESSLKLEATWRESQIHEVVVGMYKIRQKDDCWWISKKKKTEWIRMTNFTIQSNQIVLKDYLSYRVGHIRYQNSSYPFQIPHDYFQSGRKLRNVLYKFFVDHGIGVPTILGNYLSHFIDAINLFNDDVKIVGTSPCLCPCPQTPSDTPPEKPESKEQLSPNTTEEKEVDQRS